MIQMIFVLEYMKYKIDKPKAKSQSKAQAQNPKKRKGKLASGLSLNLMGYHHPTTPTHPITFRQSEWEYMVQIEAPSTPE